MKSYGLGVGVGEECPIKGSWWNSDVWFVLLYPQLALDFIKLHAYPVMRSKETLTVAFKTWTGREGGSTRGDIVLILNFHFSRVSYCLTLTVFNVIIILFRHMMGVYFYSSHISPQFSSLVHVLKIMECTSSVRSIEHTVKQNLQL